MRPGAPFSPVALGTPRLHLRVTDSTNERARALAAAGAPHGTLVTAAAQSAGRGRQGRTWSAPPGQALLMSLVLRDPPPLLPLIAGVAVCDAVGGDALVKWPNDIVVARPARPARPAGEARPGGAAAATTLAKLAGILAEGRPQDGWAVLGIGVNVAVRLEDLPPEVAAVAASLDRDPAQVEPVLAALLESLQRRLAAPPEQTLADWRERDALRGRDVTWAGGEGRAEGVDGAGRLIVALSGGGQTTLGAGEVHLSTGPRCD
jgi:BirA family biotin operon repressor/biotin-[acetyl-CoA-carboxylase] ligase